jgi:hypothetical protein
MLRKNNKNGCRLNSELLTYRPFPPLQKKTKITRKILTCGTNTQVTIT